MATMTVERARVPELLQQWLHRSGNGSDTVDLEFLPGQLVIKQPVVDEVELRAWLKDAMSRYDSALRRLSDA